jgi:outer membrane protein OmpA-like peptidoglycan-associated protein
MIVGALLLTVCSVSAQEPTTSQEEVTAKQVVETVSSTDKYRVETNKFWANWFISAGGGGLIYFGDLDREQKIGKRIAPALNINIGKWFTPGIGVRFGYDGLSMKGATKYMGTGDGQGGTHSTGVPVDPNGNEYGAQEMGQKFKFAHFHGDVMFNFSNLFCGYNEDRVWNLIPFAGVGWGRVWQHPQQDEVTMSLGILNTWRLGRALELQLDARGVMFNDRFDGEIGDRKQEGYLSVTLGLAYKFGKRNWDRGKVTTVSYDDSEIQARLRAMGEENERLRRALAEAAKREPEKVVTAAPEIIAPDFIATFPIGQTELDKEDRVNLGFLAEAMKKSENTTFVIHGYADKGTGSVKKNAELSRKRAQAVYDCLTKEFGVSGDRLKMIDEGGVANMYYDDPRLSRAVITRINAK